MRDRISEMLNPGAKQTVHAAARIQAAPACRKAQIMARGLDQFFIF